MKKIFLLALVLLLTIPTMWAQQTFPFGNGTQERPYELYEEKDWFLLCGYCMSDMTEGVYFRLMRNDIIVGPRSSVVDPQISMYTVGTVEHPFRGHFDGNGNKLTFIYIAKLDEAVQYIAPFRCVENAEIKNLWYRNVYLNNYGTHAGGLVGRSTGTTTISGCLVNVEMENYQSTSPAHGGVVGCVYSGTTTISNCTFDGWFKAGVATTDCGGFVGYVENGATCVLNSCLFAPQRQDFSADGSATFVRAHSGATVTINNCYYKQTLGAVQGKYPRTISAAEGVKVANAGTATSGSFGPTGYGVGIKYDGKLYAGLDDVVSLTLNNAEHYTHSGAFTASAGTLSSSANPYTLTMPDENVTIDAEGKSSTSWTGNGTESTPYEIATTGDLDFLATEVNAGNDYNGLYFKLKNNLEYAHSAAGETENNFTAIGTEDHPFAGHFDGNNKCICGIRIYQPSAAYQGLFGRLSSTAVVHNLHLADAYVTGTAHTGGIVGYNEGTLSNNFAADVTISTGAVIAAEGTLTDNYYVRCLNGVTPMANGLLVTPEGPYYSVIAPISVTIPAHASVSERTFYVAQEGNTVTLTPTISKSMDFYVTRDDNGAVVEVMNNSFTMPASDVTVESPCVVRTFPWTEDFEEGTTMTLHPCWDNSTSTATGDTEDDVWGILKEPGDGNYNKFLRLHNKYVSAGKAIVNSSPIILPASPALKLCFGYAHRADECSNLYVNLSTDGGYTFTNLRELGPTGGIDNLHPGVFTGAVVNLAPYAGDTIVLQFSATTNGGAGNGGTGQGAIFIDDLRIYEEEACELTDLAVSDISASHAIVSWNTNADSCRLEYSLNADFSDSISVKLVDTKAYMLTGLTSGSTYYVRVKAFCTGYRETEWNTTSFTPECHAVKLPYEDSFTLYQDNGDPDCWAKTNATWPRVHVSAGYGHNDSYCLWFEKYTQKLDWVSILPEFERPANELQLSFWYSNYYSTAADGHILLYAGYITDVNDATTFVAVSSNLPQTHKDDHGYTYVDWISFAGAPAGARLAFRLIGDTEDDWDETFRWWIDDVAVRRDPSLPDIPTAIDEIIVPGGKEITNDQSPMTKKVLRDGHLFILRGDKIYTVTGQEVK